VSQAPRLKLPKIYNPEDKGDAAAAVGN